MDYSIVKGDGYEHRDSTGEESSTEHVPVGVMTEAGYVNPNDPVDVEGPAYSAIVGDGYVEVQ